MWYLTYRKSNEALPVARDGEKIIYVTNKKENEEEDEELVNFIKSFDFYKIFEEMGYKKIREKEKLKNDIVLHLKKKVPPIDDQLRKIYDSIVTDFKSGKLKNQIISNNTLIPIGSDPTGRFVMYVSGGSGSGKSYLMSQVARQYRKLNPDNSIFLFSFVDHDKNYDNIDNFYKIPLNKKFLDQDIDWSEFENSLLLFDDYDSTFDKTLKGKIEFMLNHLLVQGRHLKASIAMTSHTNTDYKRTRLILAESTHIVIYPQSSSQKSLRYLLENYTNLSIPKIKDIVKTKNSRFVCIHKSLPAFTVTEHCVELI